MSDISVVSMDGPVINVVEATVGLQGPAGPQGAPGIGSAADVELIADAEAQELRVDIDALVAVTLSI
jgi:hypothetical protein